MFIKLVVILQYGKICIIHGYAGKKFGGGKWAKYMAREKGLSRLYYIFLKLNLSKERTRMMKTEELGKRDLCSMETWGLGFPSGKIL